MSAIWSEERKLALWTQVEILALEAWVKLGIAPESALQALRQAQPVDPAAVAAREEVTNRCRRLRGCAQRLDDEGGAWVHHGLTSSDVLDTAGAVQPCGTLLLSRVERLSR